MTPDSAPPRGRQVGPYRLLEELGRGGMGVVYKAVRADGEIGRPLALKIAGDRLVSPEAERRFLQERQILSALDHPHIVGLLDGGIADGQRYFAMEFVDGRPLTSAVADARLPIRERLTLFRQVCSAIQHAHQHLVLHRDLKPSNVLLTSDGQVKVLDFGIASLVQASTLRADTGTTQQPVSLACVSPEQLRGEPMTFTADVYALGTLLYELLTGTNPQFREGMPAEEAMRLVTENLPPRPSRLNGAVPRDLDAIAMRALAKEPAHRYQSVGELDADVARWFDGRPVVAVPPRPWYLVTRFVARNRLLTATAAALVVSLVAGAVLVARQTRIAERRFDDARRLIHATIFDIQPRMEAIPATLELRKLLIERTTTYLEAVSAEASGNVPLLQELSSAYLQLARLQGDISTSSLGNTAAAAERFARARTLLDEALSAEPRNPALLKDASLLYSRLATFEGGQGDAEAALTNARRSLEFAERNLAARPGEYDAREIRAVSLFSLALNTPASAWDDRRALFVRARDEYRTLAADNPAREQVRRNVGIVTRLLASLHYDRDRLDEATQFAVEALETSEALLAARPGDTALQLEVVTDAYQLGMVLDAAGDGRRAPAHYERALALIRPIRAVDRSNARATLVQAETLRLYAANRLTGGDTAAARRHAEAALATYGEMAAGGTLSPVLQWRYASALAARGDVAEADGQATAACAAYQQAHTLFTEVDRQAPLSDQVKRTASRVATRVETCGGGHPPVLPR